MGKSKLNDLNDILLQTIQDILDPDVDKNNKPIRDISVEKVKAITSLSREIISNARLQLDAAKLISEGMTKESHIPEVFGTKFLELKNKQ